MHLCGIFYGRKVSSGLRKRNKLWWHPLDNAAKIFPVTSNRTDTKVFRFSCCLKENVREEILSEAAQMTMEDFPIFQSVIKRGFFWYYLEKSALSPVVREEYRPPCSPIFDKNVKRLLFEVTYYKKRINLEVHHSLTDGTGAVEFLRMLVINYLRLAQPSLAGLELHSGYDASGYEKSLDSFDWYYENMDFKEAKTNKPGRVWRFGGHRLSGYRMRIIEGTMPSDAVLALSKSKETSLTALFVAMMIRSAGMSMSVKQKKYPVVVNVPVNLRAFFPSSTARNFFGVIQIDYHFGRQPDTLENIVAYVGQRFKEELTREKLMQRMYRMGKLERNAFMRSVPLALKDLFMKLAYDMNNKRYTMSLSNLGVISMPDEVKPYIDMFDIFISSDTYKACMCSYNGRLRISFTSPYEETQVQKQFFRQLSALDIPVAVASNEEG